MCVSICLFISIWWTSAIGSRRYCFTLDAHGGASPQTRRRRRRLYPLRWGHGRLAAKYCFLAPSNWPSDESTNQAIRVRVAITNHESMTRSRRTERETERDMDTGQSRSRHWRKAATASAPLVLLTSFKRRGEQTTRHE